MEPQVKTQSLNTSKSAGKPWLVPVVTGLVVLIVAASGFGGYIYVSNKNHQNEIDKLNRQIADLQTSATVTPTDVTATPTSSASVTNTVSVTSKTFKYDKEIKFQFDYEPTAESPKADGAISYQVDIDVLGDKKTSDYTFLGTRLSIIDYPTIKKNWSDIPANESETFGLIGANLTASQCFDADYKAFKKVDSSKFPGKTVYYFEKTNNTCSLPSLDQKSKPFNYPVGVYVVKLSDKYYGVVSTSSIADRTLADLVVNTLKIN